MLKLGAQVVVSLDIAMKEDSDFQTAEEAAQFHKSGKAKKLRRKVCKSLRPETPTPGPTEYT